MAKEQFSPQDIKDIKEYRDLLKSTQSQWQSINKELEKHKYVTSNTKEALKAQLKSLMDEYGTYKDIVASLKEYENLVKKIEKQQEKKVKSLEKESELQEEIEKSSKNQLINFDELNDLQRSISGEYKRQYIDAGAIEKKIDSTKALVGGINTFLEKNSDIQDKQRKSIEEAAEIYKNMPISVAELRKQLKNESITQKQYNKALREMTDEFEQAISKIDVEDEKLNGILETLQKMKEETNAWSDAMVRTGEAGEFFLGKVFGGMPGGIGEFANSIKEAKKEFKDTGTLSDLTLAGAGYLAARAKLFAGQGADLVNPTKPGENIDRNDENGLMILQSQLRYLDAINDKYQTLASASEKFYMNSSGLTKLFAEFDFETQVQLARKEFEKSSKTAFFGSGLGSTKYAKDQLALAGISAETIVSAMTDMSMGANSPMQGLAEDAAVFARKTGIATNQLASLTGMFRMLDKTGGEDAFRALTGELSVAKAQGFNPADIASELANSTELALQYNIRSGKELVRQVKSVREMGSSFSKIAEAGKNMVLNYKDSIRKEMELSALIGESVDLSVARALFNVGKDAEALKNLKESGIYEKAAQFGLTGTNLLSQAIGGVEMSQLAGQKYEKTPTGGIISNQQFLSAQKEALKTFEIGSAIINVERGGLRELLQFAPGNMGDESVGQQLAKLREGAFADANAVMVDIQKFAMREGAILEQVPVIGKVFGNLLGLIPQPGGINNPYVSGKFPNTGEKTKGTTPFNLNPYKQGLSPEEVKKLEQDEKIKKVLKEMQEKYGPASNKPIKGGLFNFSEVFEKPMQLSNESLKKIDTSSTEQNRLLQNMQTILATMSNLTDPALGLKLIIDGKDVKNRIEKIKTQEKGKMRV